VTGSDHWCKPGESPSEALESLDGFKQINDKYGHGVGDEMLVSLSQHIKEALREGDTLARIGGDEFVAVLPDLESTSDCQPVLERHLSAAARTVTLGEAALQLSASIGVTIYPQDGSDADLLLRHADQAMYIAKHAGKNRYHYFGVKSAAALQAQQESLQSITHALQLNQFVLHYQPKVNMQTGAVVGAEALIRWQHPQRGLLAPGLFLPVIENHPLSIAVCEWVIASALAQMAAWKAKSLGLPVSVNIGALQLQQDGFARAMALRGLCLRLTCRRGCRSGRRSQSGQLERVRRKNRPREIPESPHEVPEVTT
jgi:diguanylate cyclase (GGDEF)-like protein